MGHIVVVDDAAEYVRLQHVLRGDRVVLGARATDQVTEDTYLTPAGDALPYTNWNAGEPNNAGSGEDFCR